MAESAAEVVTQRARRDTSTSSEDLSSEIELNLADRDRRATSTRPCSVALTV